MSEPAAAPVRPAWPYLLFLAYVAVLYLRPQEYVPSLMGTPLVPGLLMSAFVTWALFQPKDFEAPQHRLMLALTAVIFVSDTLPDGLRSGLDAALDFLPTLLLFYVAATSIDTVARFRGLVVIVSAAAGVMAHHGITQAATPDGIGWTGAAMIDGRITFVGFFNDPNDLSMAFLMILPLTIWLAATERRRLLRWGAWVVVGMILWATYLCNSRGAILGVLAMAAMFAVRRFGWKRAVLVMPLIIVPLLVAAPSRVSEMSADEESAAGRVDAWYEGFEMLREHPVFGVGKGLFVDHNYLTAHNSFVLAIAELGVAGYFVWLANLVLTGLMLIRLLRLGRAVVDASGAAGGAPSWFQPESVPAFATSVWPGAGAAAEPEGGDTPPEGWPALRGVVAALAYSLVATLVAAFFLSRSYVNILYLLVAMVVAVHGIARRLWPARVEPIRLSDLAGRIFAIEIGSIVFLWLLTRFLLAVQ